MSSHHVVREKQEPALLVLSLDHFSDEMLGQLLEWSPTVIATSDTAEKLSVYGIKVDYIVGKEIADLSQSSVKQLDPGNNNIIQSTLKFLADSGYPSVNIVTDELQLHEYESFTNLINLVIFCDYKKIYAVPSGFSKWQAAGANIEILSRPGNLQVSGLQRLDDQHYITMHDGFLSFTFDNHFIFIAEEV